MKRIKNDHFQFKQFSVSHRRSSMKVGTDGVLLGAWVDVSDVDNVLDVGTGSGVIALMIAQRTLATRVDAVEINQEAVQDARENFEQAPWTRRLNLYHTPIQLYLTECKYDLIISNPPFFINSYKPVDEPRSTARHTESLSFQNLLKAADQLLNPHGRLAVILPPAEGLHFKTLAQAAGMTCIRHWTFRTRRNKPVERLLLEFSKIHKLPDQGEVLLYEYDSGEVWTKEYTALTREFYLKA